MLWIILVLAVVSTGVMLLSKPDTNLSKANSQA
jgi:hypothetical protein